VEKDKWLIVVYKEISEKDGFIITAFLMKRIKQLNKRKKNMGTPEIEQILNILPNLLAIPHTRIWTTYDKEADVLYINFKKPSHADDSELTDNDIIVRYEKGEIIGITVLNASKR